MAPKEPIRILYLNHVPQMSGAEAILLDLIRHLDRRWFVPFAAVPAGGPLIGALAAQDMRTFEIPMCRFVRHPGPAAFLSYLSSMLTVGARLAAIIREHGIHIVHANSTTAQLYGSFAARRTGVPSVWHCRDLVELGFIGRYLATRSSRVIAISQAVAAHLAARAPGARIEMIHNGIDVERFPPSRGSRDARQALGLPTSAFSVGMAGQLVPWKNHALFLRAASLIRAELPAAHFLVAGDDRFGDQESYVDGLKTLARELRLDGCLHWLGFQQDFALFLEALDVLVHPPGREPFGRVVAEAMAMSKPVVAVNSCGPAELISDGQDGILVEPHNPVTISQAVLRLAKDPALAKRLGTAARERVARDFDPTRQAQLVQTLYEGLAGPGTSGRAT